LLYEILVQLVLSFVITFGFAILYNIPKEALISASICGSIGYIVYYSALNLVALPLFISASLGAFAIALLSQLFARRHGMPVITFAIPAIIPMVPGGSAYNMMRSLVTGETLLAIDYLVETLLTGGAIALGLTVNSAIFQALSPRNIWQKGKRYLP